MKVSLIICTYNRAESLKETLAYVKNLATPSNCDWEVIVVDNNSADHTHDVVSQLQDTWPNLRYEFENQQGLSFARNHGIACSNGEILFFTDDDVLPEPDWIEKSLNGLEKHKADACGGFIAPIWEKAPPTWLTEKFHGFLAIRTDRTEDYIINESSQLPFGANMAFKRSVFDDFGGFDVNRGRKGNVLASGEDGEMFERLLNAGGKVVFIASAKVHHKVEGFRLTKKYFRKWRYQTSRNIALSNGWPGERKIAGIPLYIFPQLARAILNSVKSRIYGTPEETLLKDIITCHFIGTIFGLAQRNKEQS
ncbi:MAG: glycosyltransferase [Gammaproteobacteria bacterium]|nr:glycosyltransferase [Gammaproteobacteria bacterium]MBQ0838662.1 glycosyltransferase [Gammaproteobacteria bacterium]